MRVVYGPDVPVLTAVHVLESFIDVHEAVQYVVHPNTNQVSKGAFKHMEWLFEVDLNQATVVDNYAFHQCTMLGNVFMPRVVSVGVGAFSGCIRAYFPYLPSTLNDINGNAFAGTQHNNIVKVRGRVASEAFYGCQGITQVRVQPDPRLGSTTVIEEGAFANIASMERIIIEHAIIESDAFDANGTINDVYVDKDTTLSPNAFGSSTDINVMFNRGTTLVLHTEITLLIWTTPPPEDTPTQHLRYVKTWLTPDPPPRHPDLHAIGPRQMAMFVAQELRTDRHKTKLMSFVNAVRAFGKVGPLYDAMLDMDDGTHDFVEKSVRALVVVNWTRRF